MEEKYSSTALYSVNNNSSESMLAGAARQYGDVASMIGLNLPSSSQDKSSYAFELLLSKDIIRSLLDDENIKPKLMAIDYYDRDTKKLVLDESIYNQETNIWKRKAPKNRETVPSYLEIYDEVIKDSLRINQDVKTGFIRISFEHISPIFASEFISKLVEEANEYSRVNDLEKAISAISYLEKELALTNNNNIKNSINSLIESNLNIKVLANTNKDYLLNPIDPPFISEVRSSPNRINIAIIGFLLGLTFSALIVVFRDFLFTQDKN